uniref:Uncharacterized protein n=1 Tax=Nelumbo nucifera TaxID=4432 RepID=A0A822ZBV1_NELNU|nr:TPA_asm: hypothetical protein HUJ06_000617 [Nelumbo nucifera]
MCMPLGRMGLGNSISQMYGILKPIHQFQSQGKGQSLSRVASFPGSEFCLNKINGVLNRCRI